jgi:glycosyltransferase involved in cell wall biosynthesis
LKKRLLYFGDSPKSKTGFGVVAKNILGSLTEDFKIDIIGINQLDADVLFASDWGAPYRIIPPLLDNPRDPYGTKLFLQYLKNDYDIVFVQNDLYVIQAVATGLAEYRKRDNKTVFVLYFPVDSVYQQPVSAMNSFDYLVCYSQFGKQILENNTDFNNTSARIDTSNIRVIEIGVDTNTFKPLPNRDRLRKKYLRLSDPETYVVMSINRNSKRKNLVQTILAFNEYHRHVPNSILYLHTAIRDAGAGHLDVVDLDIPIRQLGLTDHIIFPPNHCPGAGISELKLNELYNCADMFLSTSLAEGWGCTSLEAMAAGIPVVLPDHTTTPEILADNRGYIYPCTDRVMVDSLGLRSAPRTGDIVGVMLEVYRQRNTVIQQGVTHRAREYTESLSWTNQNTKWLDLFLTAKKYKSQISTVPKSISL